MRRFECGCIHRKLCAFSQKNQLGLILSLPDFLCYLSAPQLWYTNIEQRNVTTAVFFQRVKKPQRIIKGADWNWLFRTAIKIVFAGGINHVSLCQIIIADPNRNYNCTLLGLLLWFIFATYCFLSSLFCLVFSI